MWRVPCLGSSAKRKWNKVDKDEAKVEPGGSRELQDQVGALNQEWNRHLAPKAAKIEELAIKEESDQEDADLEEIPELE